MTSAGSPHESFVHAGTKGAPMMDAQRQGQVALALVRYYIREKGLSLLARDRSALADVARDIKVEIPELQAFFRPMFQELVDQVFGSDAPVRPSDD